MILVTQRQVGDMVKQIETHCLLVHNMLIKRNNQNHAYFLCKQTRGF